MISIFIATLLSIGSGLMDADEQAQKQPSEALRAFNGLIGEWKASGTPEGTREQRQKGFWTESVAWAWQFKGSDAWLKVTFDKGKYFSNGELRYLTEKDRYQLNLVTSTQANLVFEGTAKDGRLILERTDEKSKETQRLTLTVLHEGSRFLYQLDTKPANRASFSVVYKVGATKQGIDFASKGTVGPECVVSGGLGTMQVSYKGKTYYVCCTGCRDAFQDEPEKYIKEFNERKAKERK